MKKRWFALLLIFAVSGLRAGNPNSVPIGHPVYQFLDRMETLGLISDLLDGIKPFSREKVGTYLRQLAGRQDELTSIDRRRLRDFLLDFRWETDRSQKYAQLPAGQDWYSILASPANFKKDFLRFFKQNHPEEENHVFLWEGATDNFYFDYEQGITYEHRSDDQYRSASWQSYQLRGVLNENFGYQAEVSLHGLRGKEPYLLDHPILKGAWSEQHDPGPRYSDRTGGELALHSSYIDVTFAQQEVEWGYGESGKLILSRNPEHYPYFSISKDWGWARFISLHGKLQSFPSDTLSDGQKIYPDKWLAAHRLEISLYKKVTLGLNENFIYGNRYADWAYLIPFNFYRAVQHKLRDRDNATISIDLEYLARPGIKLYGTVFLDEFRKSKIGTNWFGNKQAFLGGFYLVDPFGLDNISLRLEYAAIMPWVYTHKYRINDYTSDYRSLGHWAGPNSEVWYLHLKKEWHQRFQTGLIFRQFKHGANYPNENIGGDILLGRGVLLGSQQQPRDTRKFLEGILTTEKLYQVYADFELFNDFYLSGKFSITDSRTESEKKRLNEFFLGVVLKY